MSLQNFLNPVDEDNQVLEEPTLEDIIQSHIGAQEEDYEVLELEDRAPQKPVPAPAQALDAVRLLIHYNEYQENASATDIRYLRRLERSTFTHVVNSQHQTTLDSWIM